MSMPLPRTAPLRPALAALLVAAAAAWAPPARAQAQAGDAVIVEAREALGRKDKARLAALRQAALAQRHPLAMWVDYWELGSRLDTAQQGELDAFYERWRGSYVEDRLRNDWLLELGRRRDWANFVRDHAAYRMQDDREVACYAMLTQHQAGQDVKAPALAAWHAQRDLDDGCQLLARTLAEARKVSAGEIWQEMRLSVEANRPRAVRAAAALLGPSSAKAVDEVLEQPSRVLQRRLLEPTGQRQELATLALMRLAATDPDAAVQALEAGWSTALADEQAAQAWASVGRQAALRLQERAHDFYRLAWQRQREHGHPPRWSEDTLAWGVRAALRAPRLDRARWASVLQGIEALGAAGHKDPAWAYWKARAIKARARGEAEREQAAADLRTLAAGVGYYAQLAAQELDQPPALPPAPPPLTEAELDAARQTPGLQRGLAMAQLGLRDEGRREWNFTLRGLNDRELIAAAEVACKAADWQICINTSERTRELVDLRQRYPMPFAEAITARARERELEPAFVFGLIRQETRFMPALRSHAGASGLMQVMPATARWTARRIGLEMRPEQITDIDTNLRLGTTYLRLVLDDFAGSQALAAAAYNAGPGRPRRWREGPPIEAAAWAENIPFNETRDYVKKVLSNATIYAQLMGAAVPPLKARLGTTIGPRDAGAPSPDANLP
jgi:soluble lytic murein transglycosylase